MYLFFDTSANGNPKNWKGEPDDPFNWPRMTHLAWLLYNEERELIKSANDIIKPEGFSIPKNFERRHGISTEKAAEEGIELDEPLKKIKEVIDEAEYVISHNMHFNENIVGTEFYRKNIPHNLYSSNKYCLMREATWFCKIKGRFGNFKWPSLQEIHVKLYGQQFENAGDAYTDVAVTAMSFFALLDLKAIELY